MTFSLLTKGFILPLPFSSLVGRVSASFFSNLSISAGVAWFYCGSGGGLFLVSCSLSGSSKVSFFAPTPSDSVSDSVSVSVSVLPYRSGNSS